MKRFLFFAFLCCASLYVNASDFKSFETSIKADGDLIPIGFTAHVHDEKSMGLDLTVENTGTSDVAGFNVQFVLSKDNVLGNDDDYFVQYYHTDDGMGNTFLPAGESTSVGITYHAEGTAQYFPAGTWNVFVQINYDGEASDSDLDNNWIISAVTVEVPEVEIELQSPPYVANVTENSVEIGYTQEEGVQSYSYRILPAGTSTPSADWVASGVGDFVWNSPSIIIKDDVDGTGRDLAPATEYDVYVVFWYETGIHTKAYHFPVTTHPDPVSEGVDLVVTSFTMTAATERGAHYELTVKNNGDTQVSGFDIKFALSEHDFRMGGKQYWDYIRLTDPGDGSFSVLPGQSTVISGDYVASSPADYIPVGEWFQFVTINDNKNIIERYYDNNTRLSSDKIIITAYEIEFTDTPEIGNITMSSAQLNVFDEPGLREMKYLLLTATDPEPTASELAFGTLVRLDQNTGIPLTSLLPATDYILYMRGSFYDGLFPNLSRIYSIPFTTTAGDPVLNTSTELVTFTSAEIGKPLQVMSYQLSGEHLQQSVAVFAEGPFVISKDNTTFSDNLEYALSDVNNKSVTIFVKLALEDSASFFKGFIAHNTFSTSDTVDLRALIYNPKKSNFNGATSIAETGWNENNIAGVQTWELTTDAGPNGRVAAAEENKVLKIDGNTGGTQANEDWLITPELDLQAFEGVPTLVFYSKSVGAGQSLKLMYSTNYTSGAPSTATWTELDGKFPAVNSNQWKESRVGVQKSNNVHIAFVYHSTSTAASTWLIDDWRVIDEVPAAIEETLHKAFVTYPNPTQGKVSVEWMTSPTSSTVAVRIVNAQGVVVKSFNALVKDLNQKLSDHLENSTSGIYQITIADGKRNYVTRLVKQ